MQNEFINLKRPVNTGSGIADKALLALVDWFVEPDGIKGPGAWAAPGDDVIIKLSHEFKPGYKFIEIQLAPEKNSYSAKAGGDTGFVKFQNEVNVLIPGSYDILHESIANLLNKPAIVLIQDSNCGLNMWYQVGTSCVHAYISPTFQTGTTKEGQKAYAVTISNTASKVFLYEGGIEINEDIERVIARIIGSIVGTTVSLDATGSTVSGTVQYQYDVYYNDINDIRQIITLPDNTETAEFDTSILTDWNNEGFAVVLTVSNQVSTDSTEPTDPFPEQPYDAGSFDDSFSDDFDFNI